MNALFENLPVQVSLDRQIEAATRELGKRRDVYPRLVETGKMTSASMDEEIAAMQAIVGTLKAHKEALRNAAPFDTAKINAAFEAAGAPLPWNGDRRTCAIRDGNDEVVVCVDFTGRLEQHKRERLMTLILRAVTRLTQSAEAA